MARARDLPRGIYRRKNTRILYVNVYVFVPAKDGKPERVRDQISSGTSDVAEAVKFRKALIRKIESGAEIGEFDGSPTFRRYSARFIQERKESDVRTVDTEESRLKMHVLEVPINGRAFGDMLLDEIRRPHVVALVQALKRKMTAGEMAPRSVHHVYGIVRGVFRRAMEQELIDSTPCTLRTTKTELPPKEDVDPAWRDGAVYQHEEVEQLISDERIPKYRRVLYAVMFLTGVRIGEAVSCRWRDYDPKTEPLGHLTVGSSWSTRYKVLGKTKTRKIKHAPVHPTLAAMLADWKLSGWAKDQGRQPTPEDLIVPSPGRGKWRVKKGGFLSTSSSLKRMKEDLALLGLRDRGQHDGRRTFMTLGSVDGAEDRWLHFVAYGAPNLGSPDMVVRYRIQHWPTICANVAKLQISLRRGPMGTVTALLQSGVRP